MTLLTSEQRDTLAGLVAELEPCDDCAETLTWQACARCGSPVCAACEDAHQCPQIRTVCTPAKETHDAS